MGGFLRLELRFPMRVSCLSGFLYVSICVCGLRHCMPCDCTAPKRDPEIVMFILRPSLRGTLLLHCFAYGCGRSNKRGTR